MSEQSDFNSWICSNYWHKAELIACRFTDLNCSDWERLSCEWHVRYQFGHKQDPDDKYFEGNMQRRRSVDALIEKPDVSAAAEIMANSWRFEKERLAKSRAEPPPPIIITPPAPTPTPLPAPKDPVPAEPTPPAKQNPAPWVVRLSVYVGLLSPLVLLASGLLPPPLNIIFKTVWPVIVSLVEKLAQ